MVAVAVIDVAYVIIGTYAGMLGFGVDTWYVDPDDLTFAMKVSTPLFYISFPYHTVSSSLTSLALLYQENPEPHPPRTDESLGSLLLSAHLPKPPFPHSLLGGYVLDFYFHCNICCPTDISVHPAQRHMGILGG